MANKKLWAKSALLAGGWASDVSIEIDPNGTISSVVPDSEGTGAELLHGTVIPGITNLHSHAHQRAMAGLAERASTSPGNSADSFWTWRKVMYHYLERIGPDDLNAIAAQLYLEMLKNGYTGAGEFQYLHHDINGHPYSDRAELTRQCWQAAQATGIAFTALPVLYCHGGFGGRAPGEGQKRFLNTPEEFAGLYSSLQADIAKHPDASLGIAPHSLRAVTEQDLRIALDACIDPCTVHIHVAEQIKEVEDCLAFSGQRPVQWLLDHADVDKHWCLIHATHMTGQETLNLAYSGAVAGLCPTTEANLGDGFFNAMEFFKAKGRWGVGSDSHISISPVEELRWLEYGQRLASRQRNVLASPASPNTGASLYNQAVAGAAQASGRQTGEIRQGYRADLVVLDSGHPRLYGRKENALLDSWIFSGNDNPVRDVYVGGVKYIDQGRHADEEQFQSRFKSTIDRLAE